MPKAKPPSLTAAVEGFLAGKRLEGHEQVVGALLVELARAFEESPTYARARLGAELRTCLEELRHVLAREEELAARRDKRARERDWAGHG